MTITEVSSQFGLSQDTLRYYERIGLLAPVQRGRSGNRDYSQNDLRRVEFIKCMRGSGVSIEALMEYISMLGDDSTEQARMDLLIEQSRQMRERIAEMQATLDRLDAKIARYRQGLASKEIQLRATFD